MLLFVFFFHCRTKIHPTKKWWWLPRGGWVGFRCLFHVAKIHHRPTDPGLDFRESHKSWQPPRFHTSSTIDEWAIRRRVMRELPVECFNDNNQDQWRSWLSLRSPIAYISYISDQICLITLIWLGNYLACIAGHEFWDTCRWLKNHPVWYEIHPQIVVFPLSRLFSGVYDQWLHHRIFHHWGEFSSSKASSQGFRDISSSSSLEI